jgi:hypothetical protein
MWRRSEFGNPMSHRENDTTLTTYGLHHVAASQLVASGEAAIHAKRVGATPVLPQLRIATG